MPITLVKNAIKRYNFTVRSGAMDAITFKNVSFRYGENDKNVLTDVSFSVEEGSFLCILGRNGSGKSTMARLMNGLLTPTVGEVSVYGKSTANKADLFEIRKNAGIVFQNPDNQQVATIVEDDIAFGPENIGVPREEIGKRIDFALKATGMEGFRFSDGQSLSGGQKQRVAIAGVLAIQPKILILDESTAMLDPKGREEVLKVVKELNGGGMTVVMITHYMEEAELADRVLVVSDGGIKIDDAPLNVFSGKYDLGLYGLELPRAIYIRNELIAAGINIDKNAVTKESVAREICKLLRKD